MSKGRCCLHYILESALEDNLEHRYNDYLDYYLEQSGSGIGYYSGRRYVPSGQEGDGLGDLFRAAKPALMGFAKRAGKSVLSAGASVLRDVIEDKNAGGVCKKCLFRGCDEPS